MGKKNEPAIVSTKEDLIFEVNHCGDLYRVTIDKKKLGQQCAKAHMNKKSKSHDGALGVEALRKESLSL